MQQENNHSARQLFEVIYNISNFGWLVDFGRLVHTLWHFYSPVAFPNFLSLFPFFLSIYQNAVNASPKNRFAWHIWGLFEASVGNTDKGRKLLKIGHALNPRDAVLLQSLALLEYKYSTANLARVLFRKASQLDPKHQPVWIVRTISTRIFPTLNVLFLLFVFSE